MNVHFIDERKDSLLEIRCAWSLFKLARKFHRVSVVKIKSNFFFIGFRRIKNIFHHRSCVFSANIKIDAFNINDEWCWQIINCPWKVPIYVNCWRFVFVKDKTSRWARSLSLVVMLQAIQHTFLLFVGTIGDDWMEILFTDVPNGIQISTPLFFINELSTEKYQPLFSLCPIDSHEHHHRKSSLIHCQLILMSGTAFRLVEQR